MMKRIYRSEYSVFGPVDGKLANQTIDVQTIVNTINCRGVMGTGLALEFRLRYPKMYEDYKLRCEKGLVRVGRPYLYNLEKPYILNFPTKDHWKYPSKLEWIEEGLKYFADNYKSLNIKSIAFPKLGTDKGGLNWRDVKKLIEKYLKDVEIPVFICYDKKPDLIEQKMIQQINSLGDSQELKEQLEKAGIKRYVIKSIVDNLPIERFRDLIVIEGVGSRSYEKLHNFFYNRCKFAQGSNVESTRKYQARLNHFFDLETRMP